MDEKRKPLHEIVDKNNFDIITSRIMKGRKVTEGIVATYETFEQKIGDKLYVIIPEHVTLDYLVRYANRSCKTCNGQGTMINNILKTKISNPQDFILLADRPFDTLTEEEKKLYMEAEKKKTMWRILLPCRCVINKAMKNEPELMANQMGNVVVRVNYEIKDAPIEETGIKE